MVSNTRGKKNLESKLKGKEPERLSSIENARDNVDYEAQTSDDDQDESNPGPSAASKEVEAMNQLFDLLVLVEDKGAEVEIGSAGNPTKEDLDKLLRSYERRLANRVNSKALLLVRFNDAKMRLKRIQLDDSIKDDALSKLTEQKESLLKTLIEDTKVCRRDIEELKDALKTNHGYVESEPTEPKDPEPNRITIKWNPSNPEHDALHRIFKEDNVPLLENSEEVDYSKIKKRTFPGAPFLDLDLSKVPVEDIVKEAATRVVTFRDDFERFYGWNLTDVLFDKMAWDYMASSLTKVGGLAKDYTDLITEVPLRERNWSKVVACLNKALKFELLAAHLADEVLKTRPKKGESVLAFTQRLRPLLEAAEVPDDGCVLLSKALCNHLSDIGFQATMKEYGSFDGIKSMKAYLKFLADTPGAFDGTRTNHSHWFIKKYGGKDGAQAVERMQANPKGEHDDKPNVLQRHKRFRSNEEQGKDKGQKKQKTDPKVCSYSEKCQRLRLKHPKEKCFHWQKDNGISAAEKSDSQKHEGKKPLKTAGAFARINEEEHLEGINLNGATFFSSYSSSPHTSLRHVNAFKGPAQGDNRIAIPIGIMGEQCTALLDPGATISLLNKEKAEDLGIRFVRVPKERIEMIRKGTSTDSIITCDKVQLVCNQRSVEHQLGVMDIDYYDIVIGMDLFSRFGFSITGITMPDLREEEFLWVPSDEKPPIVPTENPPRERSAEFIQMKQDFMKALEPYLQANADIDPRSHCTLDSMKVTLKVRPNCVIQERSRPFHSQTEKEEVERTIQKWWDTGVIVPAPKGCPYNNSLTMAARRDLDGNITKYRVCLDPRTLNRQLEDTDNFPLPLITDVQQRVAGHKYFTTIDLSQAYHRMPVDKASQPLTAFTYNGKQYMFARAPFGLKPLTSIFQRGMSQLLGDLHYGDNYVDDIISYSHEVPDHLTHVITIVKRLTEAGLIINREKSNFLSTEVLLLGFIVNEEGRHINTEKIANVQSWALPTNKKMIQRYLGLFNYFREYIPLYSTISAPLDALRNAKGTFVLNDLQRRSFDAIRNLIAQAPALSFPNFKEPFFVATDASNVGIGAVLYQLPNGKDDESKVHYISFQARALHKHEKNYPAYKKELLAIIFALMKFHQYLWGRRFTLYTDHRPLTYIHEQKELPQIITNWKATLLNYNFECVYRPGMLNVIPDALSRAFPDELWKTEEGPKSIARAEPRNVTTSRSGLRNVEQLIQCRSPKNSIIVK
jgi:hypothetical protein